MFLLGKRQKSWLVTQRTKFLVSYSENSETEIYYLEPNEI
jgi:hypothetical protein